MQPCCSYSSGADIFCDWVIPEGIIHRRLGNFYHKHPVLSRIMATPIALVSGFAKLLLFPLACIAGVVAMPIIAIIRSYQGKGDAGNWLKAWCFSILGIGFSIGFIGVVCYHMPLVTSAAFVVIILSGSIIIHVYKLVREPSSLAKSLEAIN